MCESFLKHAQRDPSGELGKSIIFAVNQTHATNLTKILNEIQPTLAVTITSRIPDASSIAKDFRDGKRPEKVAVSVDMLSTGYNCKDLLNVVLMRPIFSPTEYIQIKGRGTRLFTFRTGNTEYDKKFFYLMDFCAVAEYFEEKYDYSVPLPLPRPKLKVEPPPEGPKTPGTPPSGPHEPPSDTGGTESGPFPLPPAIPIWTGRDLVASEEVRIIGPNGEKVDVMTFRGSFERDVAAFAKKDANFKDAVEEEDDDAVETILQERFFHKPEMYYSSDKLVRSYGVPAPTSAFVYSALGRKPLPTKDDLISDTVDTIASQFNLRYNEQKLVSATVNLLADDPESLKKFLEGDMTIFTASQFTQLGGLPALLSFKERDAVFEAVRQSILVRQSVLGASLS
jgi:type I restriction enzyme R subunit